MWSQDPLRSALSGAALSSSGGLYIVDFLNVSILWRVGCWVDKETETIQRESGDTKCFFCHICQIYCRFYLTEDVHSIMFRFPSSEAHFSCSSSNPFWNIAISASLCFRAIYTCFPCPCASCFTSPGIPRTLSHLFLISVSIFCTAAAVRGNAAKQNFSFMTVGSWSSVISEPYRAVRYCIWARDPSRPMGRCTGWYLECLKLASRLCLCDLRAELHDGTDWANACASFNRLCVAVC